VFEINFRGLIALQLDWLKYHICLIFLEWLSFNGRSAWQLC